ncbi:MAG: 30S ribosome-binding factor RbfA [Anaerolineaceae bacterium]
MPSTLRMKRINDRIKEILSITLLTKMEDPRLTNVYITDVKVDRELDFANVYVSAVEGAERSREVLEALNHARGFLKFELANEIDLRVMPKLRFFWDSTPEKADRIDTLLAQIRGDTPMTIPKESSQDLEEGQDG